MLRIIILGLYLGFASFVSAQTLTLKQAVEQAVEQSLDVQQAKLQLRSDEITLHNTELSRYPSINFRTTGGYQFGLSVDRTTNALVQQSSGFLTPSLDASAPIYQGGRIRRTIIQNRSQIAASEANVEVAQQNVSLQVAQNYLEALLAKEELYAAETRLKEAKAELDRFTKLIAAGSAAQVGQLELQSTVARLEQGLVTAKNQLQLSELRLKQLIRMPIDEVLTLLDPNTIDFDAINLQPVSGVELYQAALSRQPSIRAAEFGEVAAAQGIDVAKSAFYPSISAFGQLDTRYSTEAFRPTGDPTFDISEQTVFVNGQQVTLGIQQPNFMLERIPIGTQFNQFFGQAVGLSLNVPIFNAGQNQANLERAKLQLETAKQATETQRQLLEIEVEQAYQNALAGKADVEAAKRALEAATTSFEALKRRQEIGAASAYELTNSQLLLEQAQARFLQARYQYLFNVKVVDFYLGRPLDLN